MNCDKFREQIPECLAGKLEPAARETLIAHVDTCAHCRADLAEMGTVWRGLGALPVAEPDPAMRSRFLEVLEAYQAGMNQAREIPAAPARSGGLVGRWWPARAVWQAAFSLALLAAGSLGTRLMMQPAAPKPNMELAQLQNQVESLRQTVALTMLQDQSPSSRIRGVGYSSQVARPDREMEQALLYTLNHDANVNVRLSATDALEKLASNAEIRRALVDALPLQDSPLVEIALMDILVENHDKTAIPAMRKLAQDAQADEYARQRAEAGIHKLEAFK
jgi:HEAT repeats/Putative zinc-finger